MKLSKALDHFKVLASKADNKPERKVYNKFVGILSNLQDRDLTEDEVQSIEEKMEELNLNGELSNTKRNFNRKPSSFTKYLIEKLSLITEGYYTALGITFGVTLGVAVAPMFERQMRVSINLGLAMMLGAAIGQYFDAKAVNENRVLKTKLG
ncbi:MAG: hypothetical protein JKX84_00505 [Flavobacteriales bacterium]|nr:hypothetical protein [Flavobacteriales bacterium]